MKKILLSVGIIAIVAIGAIGATRAYFSDTESSTGNTFTAGTMDLQINTTSGGTHTVFNVANIAPGISYGPQTLTFTNSGTTNGKLSITSSYALLAGGVSADDFAKHMLVVSGVTGGEPVQGYWAQHIIDTYTGGASVAVADGAVYEITTGNYVPTFYGLSKITLKFEQTYNGTPVQFTPAMSVPVAFTIEMSPNAGNEYQSVSGTVSLNANMVQWENPTY